MPSLPCGRHAGCVRPLTARAAPRRLPVAPRRWLVRATESPAPGRTALRVRQVPLRVTGWPQAGAGRTGIGVRLPSARDESRRRGFQGQSAARWRGPSKGNCALVKARRWHVTAWPHVQSRSPRIATGNRQEIGNPSYRDRNSFPFSYLFFPNPSPHRPLPTGPTPHPCPLFSQASDCEPCRNQAPQAAAGRIPPPNRPPRDPRLERLLMVRFRRCRRA